MANGYECGIEMRGLEKMIKDFAFTHGRVSIVLESLLDYIIGFLDAEGKPIDGWSYNAKETECFADMTQEYFRLMSEQYGMKTLQMGERKSVDTAEESIGYFYECILNGMCIYNYERFCKKIMTDIKKKGRYGEYWHKLIKPIKIEVEQLNLDCLWQKYKVTKTKETTCTGGA